jgi:hypothetical protein
MRATFLAAILISTTVVVAQSTQFPLPAVSAPDAGIPVSKHCASVEKKYNALKKAPANTSTSDLISLEARGESCLDDVFALLGPEQRATAKAAFRLFQAANSELVSQMRQRDAAEEHALADWEMRDGGHRLASLFGQYSLLNYQYDQLLDEIQKYMEADDKFHRAVTATAPAGTLLPPPIVLPGKTEFLNCTDYHVGRFSACWPPDDD